MANVSMRDKVLAGWVVLIMATAAGAESRFAITPMLGYRNGGSFTDTGNGTNADVDHSGSYALALNMAAAEGGDYELFYSRQASQLGTATPVDINVEYLHLGGTTLLSDSDRVIPYIGAGVGATRFTPQSAVLKDATRWSLSLAGGVKVPLREYFALRFELRGYVTWINGRTDLFCVSSSTAAGCSIEAKGESLFQYEALGGVAFKF